MSLGDIIWNQDRNERLKNRLIADIQDDFQKQNEALRARGLLMFREAGLTDIGDNTFKVRVSPDFTRLIVERDVPEEEGFRRAVFVSEESEPILDASQVTVGMSLKTRSCDDEFDLNYIERGSELGSKTLPRKNFKKAFDETVEILSLPLQDIPRLQRCLKELKNVDIPDGALVTFNLSNDFNNLLFEFRQGSSEIRSCAIPGHSRSARYSDEMDRSVAKANPGKFKPNHTSSWLKSRGISEIFIEVDNKVAYFSGN